MNIGTNLEFLKTFGSGWKTYVAAAGLAGLAVYQLSAGQYETAVQTVLAALAAAGLRNAVSKASVASSGRAV